MKRSSLIVLLSAIIFCQASAQSITGVWRGKVSRGIKIYNLELKLIKNGDSLSGTSYYYHSPTNYSRFRVKGYFDTAGDIVWWDKELVESKGGKISSPNTTPFRFAADFNCPGDDIMKLDGTADKKGDEGRDHEVHLSKVEGPYFKDEWDEVIEDFPYYASVPDYIDSIERSSIVSSEPPTVPASKLPPPAPVPVSKAETTAVVKAEPPPAPVPVPKAETAAVVKTELPSAPVPVAKAETTAVVKAEPPPVPVPVAEPEKKNLPATAAAPVSLSQKAEIPSGIKAPKTIQDIFVERKKILVEEILVSGDSIRLDFYDNAEVDGDSITLFLNGKMIHQHVLLKAIPFEFKIAVSELQDENELTMVAENLGSIPPNTSLMIVWVNGVRHEARLESTENSSAMIRFRKKRP
ncbi:MAG TPA: hypothetical protein VFX73_01175 [Chitinophagaceae bacterium]|nr:hypothetical protein [Chitinophagaceae bacterium]